MPSSDPSIAMHFYFHILKPLGPAPKFCVQMPFPPCVSIREIWAKPWLSGWPGHSRQRHVQWEGASHPDPLPDVHAPVSYIPRHIFPKLLCDSSPRKLLGISWTQVLQMPGYLFLTTLRGFRVIRQVWSSIINVLSWQKTLSEANCNLNFPINERGTIHTCLAMML